MDELEIEQLKNAWLTYEEIQGIIEAEQNIIDWKVLSEEEMNHFIKNELFSNYMVNV